MNSFLTNAKVKTLVRTAAFVLAWFFLSCGAIQHFQAGSRSQTLHLVVLHTNDSHGHPVKFFKHPTPDVGGLPARATLVKQIRGQNKNVLVLDGGDLNTGKPESNLFKARPDIEGYNYIGYDAMVLGNHEFDHPLDLLKLQMKLAEFPFLSANVRTKQGPYVTRPYMVKEFDGFSTAIFGLTTKETEFTGNPEHTKNLVFEDEIRVAKNLVPELRKKADIVIALVHMGIYDSLEKGSKRLASEVSGIDLIVDGHTHTKLDAPIVITHPESGHSTLIVQAWKWGLVLGRVDLFIQNKKVIDYTFQAIPINLKTVEKQLDGTRTYHYVGEEIPEDEVLLELLEPYVAEMKSLLSEVIGHAEETFFSKDVRKRETPLGNLVADSMLWYTKNMGVDFALQNGGGIRSDIPKGEITKESIYGVLPFENSVVVLTLDGSTVQSLCDYIATISSGQGGFPQLSEGLSLTINTVTETCEEIMIDGKPLDPNKTYKIATNSYLAAGGDGYTMLLNALDRYEHSLFLRDVLINYIKYLGGSIKPQTSGRINYRDEQTCHGEFQLAA